MSDFKLAVIENIVIYIIVTVGIVITKTGWPLFLLIFVNTKITGPHKKVKRDLRPATMKEIRGKK